MMYYRVAIQLDPPLTWQWKSTVLSSLHTLFQFLRLYSVIPQDYLRVFSASSREGLEEQLVQENKGLGSNSATAAQFLQERLIRSPEVARGTSEREVGECQKMPSVAVSTETRLNESSRAAHTLDERSISSLERRRLELELGTGGDHDVPYSFALSASMPQVLAWMGLLAKVHRGELQP
jgi:hypothetical protein